MRNVSLLLTILFAASATYAAAPTREQLTTTLQDLAKSKETELQLKKRLEATERDMEKMRARAAKLADALQSSEERVSKQEDALARANADFAAKRLEFESRKSDYADTVVNLLRMRQLPATAFASSSEDTQALLRTAAVLEKTNEAIAAKARRLRSDMETMKALQGIAKAQDTTTRAEQARLKIEREKLARELVGRQELQAKLSADHARAEERVAELSRTSKSLQELIDKLAEEEKKDLSPKSTAKLRDFEGKKGSLKTPVNGTVLHRFGEKQNGNSTYRGMVFKTRASATVVAPYDGEVVFTGPFRDYGKMVLMKHKSGYISMIAGLGKINTQLGQTAIRGEPIGQMPESGSLEAYVELRGNDAKPIDPADWFANVVNQTAQQ